MGNAHQSPFQQSSSAELATSQSHRADLPSPSPGGPGLQDAPAEIIDERFDEAIAVSEQFWAGVQSSSHRDPMSDQMRRFATPILTEIEILREFILSRDPEIERAVVVALDLGRRIGDAKWQFGARDRIRIGERVSGGGPKGQRGRQSTMHDRREELRVRVEAALQKNPDASMRSIAMKLLPASERTDADKINSMAKRCARSLKKN